MMIQWSEYRAFDERFLRVRGNETAGGYFMPGIVSVKDLPANRPMDMAARLARAIAVVCLVSTGISGCSGQSHEAFVRSHDSIRVGMTLGEVFRAGLADYLGR